MQIITERYTKAMKVFIKKAAQYGGKLVSDKGKHLKFRDTLGHQISAPKTTSDWRAIKNFESELRGRGFVNQETVKKVKDSLVKNTNVTAIPSRRTPPAGKSASAANRQTTFKDFTQKYQPNVQGPKKSELQVQADHILRTTKKTRKMITKSQLDTMQISDKEKQKLIRQGLINMSEALTPEEKKNAKLNYQYKDVTNPRRPSDPIKDLKKGRA